MDGLEMMGFNTAGDALKNRNEFKVDKINWNKLCLINEKRRIA